MKTYANWNCDLDEYLQIGDIVDEEMYDYFINVLPPATFKSYLVQIGEPANHIQGRPTFATLKRTEEGWMYCGECHRGETEEPKEE